MSADAGRPPHQPSVGLMPVQPARLGGELWGLATYFNPAGYANKRENLRLFADRIRAQGLPLLVIELAIGDAPHELDATVADRLVQVRSHSVLWQKERLLNIGLEKLPATCDKVAWLDADVLFEDARWIEDATRLLQEYVVVQLYDTAWLLPPNCTTLPLTPACRADAKPQHGAVCAYRAGYSLTDGHLGLAWAARKRVLETHGLYDRAILGSGDLIFVLGSLGLFDDPDRHALMTTWSSERLVRDAARWGQRLHADVRGSVSYVSGSVLHLWHGSVEDRQYLTRHLILKETDFDPCTDISLDDHGCWRWSSDKPDLHRLVTEYFWNRREEGGASSRPSGEPLAHVVDHMLPGGS